jgi:hypothetical protein
MQGPLRLIIEPRKDSSVKQLDINAKVFSKKAIDAVLELGARVAEADDGGLRDGIVLKSLHDFKQRRKK